MKRQLGMFLLMLSAVSFILYGVFFFTALLTGSALDTTNGILASCSADIQTFCIFLEGSMRNIIISLGLMFTAIGVSVALLTMTRIKQGVKWAWWTSLVSLLITMAVAAPIHIPNNEFVPLPAAVPLISTFIALIGFLLMYSELKDEDTEYVKKGEDKDSLSF